jgi:hypothetical protein
MSGKRDPAFTYKNGMTVLGIHAPESPDDFVSEQFCGLDVCSRFLDGSLQMQAQQAVRNCMNKGLGFDEISMRMRTENEFHNHDHVISCNMAYALSIPAPDWSELYQYCRLSSEAYDNDFLSFDFLMREVCLLNLANTYAIVYGAQPEALGHLRRALGYNHDHVMRLALLFDDESAVTNLIDKDASPLMASACVDRNIAMFVYDPFSAIRASRKPSGGMAMGELYARTTNQIMAIFDEAEHSTGFFSLTPTLQFKTVPQCKPQKTICPISGVAFFKPSTGLLRKEDLALPDYDHKLLQMPQFSNFINHFKSEIGQFLSESVSTQKKPIQGWSTQILAGIAQELDRQGFPLKYFFLQHFGKLTPGAIMDIDLNNACPKARYLKLLLEHNTSPLKSRVEQSMTDFLIAAESPQAFKELDLDDEQLRAVYRHFPDKDLLSIMSESGVSKQLECDLGL